MFRSVCDCFVVVSEGACMCFVIVSDGCNCSSSCLVVVVFVVAYCLLANVARLLR